MARTEGNPVLTAVSLLRAVPGDYQEFRQLIPTLDVYPTEVLSALSTAMDAIVSLYSAAVDLPTTEVLRRLWIDDESIESDDDDRMVVRAFLTAAVLRDAPAVHTVTPSLDAMDRRDVVRLAAQIVFIAYPSPGQIPAPTWEDFVDDFGRDLGLSSDELRA